MQQVFAEFWAALKQNADRLKGHGFLQHADYKMDDRIRRFECGRFIQMADDYTSRLIGEVNYFLLNIAHADSWIQVAQKHEQDERISLLAEFADPLLELSVGRPYSLKNQVMFAAVQLLHRSNKLKSADWKDDLPPDDEIEFEQLEKVGVGWRKFKRFRKTMEKLNGKQFRITATRDFRHVLQHRYRTHFGFGLTPLVKRDKTESGIIETDVMIPPLNLKTLLPELYTQHKIAVEVFQAYWQLVNEICSEWDRRYAI